MYCICKYYKVLPNFIQSKNRKIISSRSSLKKVSFKMFLETTSIFDWHLSSKSRAFRNDGPEWEIVNSLQRIYILFSVLATISGCLLRLH